MTGIRRVAAVGLAIMLAATAAQAADEPDELMPGGSVLIRYGVVAKFVAKAATPFDLPDAGNVPTLEGATLSVFDTGSAQTDVYALPSLGWTGLGVPYGSRGW